MGLYTNIKRAFRIGTRCVGGTNAAVLQIDSNGKVSQTTTKLQLANGAAVMNEATGVTNPVFLPNGADETTGIGGNSNNVSLIAAGTELVRVANTDLKIGGPAGSNYAKFSADGDLDFAGGSGLTFGDIYGSGVASSITSSAVNDYDQLLGFASNGVSNGDATPDHTNDHITVTTSGVHLLLWQWSGYSTTAAEHTWGMYLRLNNGGTDLVPLTRFRTAGSSAYDVVSGYKLASLTANDTVELWVRRFSAGTDINFTSNYLSLSALKIGG